MFNYKNNTVMTKKLFMFAALLMAFAAFAFMGCNNHPTDPDMAKIAAVKKAAMGSWVGELKPLLGGEGEMITVTFTENKITTTGNLTVNITAWKCQDGDVWVVLDDEMQSAMSITIEGNKMRLAGNSTFIWMNFPSELTKK